MNGNQVQANGSFEIESQNTAAIFNDINKFDNGFAQFKEENKNDEKYDMEDNFMSNLRNTRDTYQRH